VPGPITVEMLRADMETLGKTLPSPLRKLWGPITVEVLRTDIEDEGETLLKNVLGPGPITVQVLCADMVLCADIEEIEAAGKTLKKVLGPRTVEVLCADVEAAGQVVLEL
jgi:predicted RNA methylase